MEIKKALFGNLDFDKIPQNKDFKEADVRAVIIDPILKELGFTHETILREKSLRSPFLRTGSTSRPVNLVPDYVLKIADSCAWVLDAKAPVQKVVNNENVEQVYMYATHPEIRSNYFALCNGLEFVCYRTNDDSKPFIHFHINEIDQYWPILQNTLSPESFQEGKAFTYETIKPVTTDTEFDYAKCQMLKEIPVRKRAVRRHFGVHGYFTRQSWDIVNAYIKNFTKEEDLVLDPFGGTGVTAIEALVTNRKAINIDINPMAVFMVQSLLAPVNINQLIDSYNEVKKEYIEKEPKTKKEIDKILKEYPGPKKMKLPKGSDVQTVPELFSYEQTAELALLKGIINKVKDKNIRETLMLVLSGMITKENLTYHTATAQRGNNIVSGNASAFQYYRYRIAPVPCKPDFKKYLDIRFKKILEAKKEIINECMLINKSVLDFIEDAQIIKGSATDLSFIENESVDYIYTDPPYGAKIPYLDLSAMWNAWLDVEVTEEDYKLEAIEGGKENKSKEEYNNLIAQSIKEMYRVLKFDRWMSFVFAHKDPEFWHLIIDTCERCGFQYMGAVPQKNGQTSFKKRQHPFTVLSGQLIINFRKVKNPKAILKANLGVDFGEMIIKTIEGVIAHNEGATIEQINDELIIKGLENGFLDLLQKEYKDLTPLLLENFDYDNASEKYNIKKNNPFKTHIDEKLRIRYFLLSFLKRKKAENTIPTINEIVFHIMPLLKNGTTPEHQTILSVLEDIAERVGDDGWQLKNGEKGLFDYIG